MNDSDFSPKDYGRLGLSYANWRKMSGMDKSPFPVQKQATGIPPPTIGQELSSLKSQFAAIPGAFGQAASGNFQQAEKMMTPSYPQQPGVITPVPSTNPAPVIDNGYDYESGIETSGLDMGNLNDAGQILSMFG